MDANLTHRYESLKRIFKVLVQYKLIKPNTKINYSLIMSNIYCINLLLFKSYKIFKKPVSREQKITLLSKLQDSDGKQFINRNMAIDVLDHYADQFVVFYDSFRKNYGMKGGNIMKGGYENQEIYKNNVIDKIINDKIFVPNMIDIYNNSPIKNYVPGISQSIYITKNIIINSSEFIFNWVFFPLYQIEQIPVVGDMVGIPLDIMGIIMENADIIMDFIGPFMGPIITFAASMASAIPIPPINTIAAAAAMGSTVASKPIEWLLENYLNIISFYINISRKQWGLAYLEALQIIPNFSNIMELITTNLFTANKYLNRTRKFTDFLNESSVVVIPLSRQILNDPSLLYDPNLILEKIILPNKDRIPIIKNMPIEKYITNFNKLLEWKDLLTRPINQPIV